MDKKPEVKKKRFQNWIDFKTNLTGFSKEIISLAECIHEFISGSYPCLRIDYSGIHVSSFKTPSKTGNNKTVFAYMWIQKKTIKLYFSSTNSISGNRNIKKNPDHRRRNEYILILRLGDNFTQEYRNLIINSYENIEALCI